MSGVKRRGRRVSFKLTFPDGTPSWYRKVWAATAERIEEYASYAGVTLTELSVHWHEDYIGTSKCSLGEAAEGVITLCCSPTDEDTFLHEVAHLMVPGQHSVKWARAYVDLMGKFMPIAKAKAAAVEAWKMYPAMRKVVKITNG